MGHHGGGAEEALASLLMSETIGVCGSNDDASCLVHPGLQPSLSPPMSSLFRAVAGGGALTPSQQVPSLPCKTNAFYLLMPELRLHLWPASLLTRPPRENFSGLSRARPWLTSTLTAASSAEQVYAPPSCASRHVTSSAGHLDEGCVCFVRALAQAHGSSGGELDEAEVDALREDAWLTASKIVPLSYSFFVQSSAFAAAARARACLALVGAGGRGQVMVL